MFKLLFAFLVLVTVFLLIVFISGLGDLREEEKSDFERYLDKIFGKNRGKIFKSVVYDNGDLSQIVYVPQSEWFKAPKYQWFEFYVEDDEYKYVEIER